MKKDPFAVLGINREEIDQLPSADEQVTKILKAYKTKAREFHPDRNKSEDAVSKFKEATAAYDAIIDPKKLDRIQRDEWDTSWTAKGTKVESSSAVDDLNSTSGGFRSDYSSQFSGRSGRGWQGSRRSSFHSDASFGQEEDFSESGTEYSHDFEHDPESLRASARYYDIEKRTIDALNQYMYQIGFEESSCFNDPSLLWALRRAQEILGNSLNEDDNNTPSRMTVPPPNLFQFRIRNSEAANNMGFQDILCDKVTYEKDPSLLCYNEKPAARRDMFFCDTLFVSSFIAALAPDCKAWSNPLDVGRLRPNFIAGRFKDDNQIGFVISEHASDSEASPPVKKHCITLVTPDIERTRKALEIMLEKHLISPQQLHEMLEYGYAYRHIPGLTRQDVEMDKDLLDSVENILGLNNKKPIALSNPGSVKHR